MQRINESAQIESDDVDRVNDLRIGERMSTVNTMSKYDLKLKFPALAACFGVSFINDTSPNPRAVNTVLMRAVSELLQ